MRSPTEEARRFPFIPLSVSDWLIRKHHPIRDEQMARQLQAVTPVEYNTVYSVEMESLFPSNSLHLDPTSCSLPFPSRAHVRHVSRNVTTLQTLV